MTTLLSALTVIAIITGPILAIRIQKLIERIAQKRQEKKALFMTLMSTRGRPLLPEHVQALNMIDVIFSGKGKIMSTIFSGRSKKDKAVVEAWSEYRDHLLNDYPKQPSSEADRATYQARCDVWQSKSTELLTELLGNMATSLNYHFDKVLLRKGAYTPIGYNETWFSQLVVQRGLTEVFLGTKAIPIHIVEPTPAKKTKPSDKDSSKPSKEDAQQEKTSNKPPTA